MDTVFEEKARKRGFKVIAGIDEAGRGPLAGPVVAAACILPQRLRITGINDSKKLTAQQRAQVFAKLTRNQRIVYSLGVVHSQEIDSINIYHATLLAMCYAVEALSLQPDCLLIDGKALPNTKIPAEAIVGGDGLSLSIAAASIIAKVTRDRMMDEYHEQWPHYGFNRHKGYATDCHRKAILEFGPCPIHRASFGSLKS